MMQKPFIEKVTVNIGVGQSGERLENAKKLLEEITGKKAVYTLAKVRNPTWGIRKGMPIGVKVTLRGKDAVEFLKKAFYAVKNKLKKESFDKYGNVSFGVKEYIDFPGIKYKPEIGMYGFDVCITIRKPGYRVALRRRAPAKVGKRQRVNPEEAMELLKNMFNVEIVG
jgi:large subunit ribosomal protein L5